MWFCCSPAYFHFAYRSQFGCRSTISFSFPAFLFLHSVSLSLFPLFHTSLPLYVVLLSICPSLLLFALIPLLLSVQLLSASFSLYPIFQLLSMHLVYVVLMFPYLSVSLCTYPSQFVCCSISPFPHHSCFPSSLSLSDSLRVCSLLYEPTNIIGAQS